MHRTPTRAPSSATLLGLLLLAALCAPLDAVGLEPLPEPPPAPPLPAPPPPPEPAAPAAPSPLDASATRGFGELMRILVRKGRFSAVQAERLAPAGSGLGAIDEVSRYLQVMGLLTPGQLDEVIALLEAGTPGAGPRAFAELVRALFEKGELNDGELEMLLSPEGVRRVTYVPEIAKIQIREQLRRELLEQMKREGWASPNVVPSWLQRLKFSGDVRVRYERDLFGKGNNGANGDFVDFNAVNNNKPFDVNFVDISGERYLDVDQNRTRPRLRARLATDADLGQGFAAGIHLASGENASPVSTNQTLGTGFSKYQFWVDRAFIKWDALAPGKLTFLFGRFANPFFRTDLVWDEDLNFDGLGLQGSFPVGKFRPFFAAGAFPVFTTALAFAPERPEKFSSFDKWLYALQLGTGYQLTDSLGLKLGVAYYHFANIEGRPSSPCDTNLSTVSCDTDHTRPPFAQKGNTYMTLRTPSDKAVASGTLVPQYEFFGLASKFQEVVITGRAEVGLGGPLRFAFDAEYVRNLAWTFSKVEKNAINNFGPIRCDSGGCIDHYEGGNQGYLARVSLGTGTTGPGKRGDWNVGLAYRYVETDAVVDGFNDSDFGLGGTNLEGYSVTASVAVGNGVWTTLRWYSADSIIGPPFQVDVLQIDLLARF
jgi:hypothetical protein